LVCGPPNQKRTAKWSLPCVYCQTHDKEYPLPCAINTTHDNEVLVTFNCLRCVLTLVESEAFVLAFSPVSTLEPGPKAFHRRGPKWSLETPPLVLVGITNRDKRTGSQRHFPAMIDAGFYDQLELPTETKGCPLSANSLVLQLGLIVDAL
jgi:hypothetical protein